MGKLPTYVEHENIIYRDTHPEINHYGEMVQGGKWAPAWRGADAAAFGRPMSETEARAFHGAGRPQEGAAQAAKDSDHAT